MSKPTVAIVGRPNVGKSTLLNTIIGKKIAITSNKPQTTRNNIQGIYNDHDTQMIFIDTPGIHKPDHKLGKFLNRQAYYGMNDADVILFLVDASEGLGKGDKFVTEKLADANKPVILIINKIDRIPIPDILLVIDKYKDLYNWSEIIPVSAMKKDNIDCIIKVLKKYLPDSMKYYEDDMYTNSSINFLMTEMVREKVLELTDQEVPHAVTCAIEQVDIEEEKAVIYINIIVDRDSLKKIIIGKQGSMLKEIGTKAREDIEKLLNKKVYLELYVKTVKKWRDKDKHLHELGFNDK